MVKIIEIQQAVAKYFEVNPQSMRSPEKQHHFAYPRMIAMALSRELTNRSLQEIGNKFGQRHHTTVLHAVHRVNHSPFLRDNADRMKEIIAGAPHIDRSVTLVVRPDAMAAA